MRRPGRRTAGLVLLALLALLAAGGVWYVQPQPLLPEAAASLASDARTRFAEADGRLEWSPSGAPPAAGLVVYPGGKVPPAAYGPLARAIAGEGYLVIVAPMPLNLAVLDIDAAARAIAAHPEVTAWALAGHSLGGSMAAQFAASHPGAADGLALWASYAATDLSGSGLQAVSVYGSLDAAAERMGGAEARASLPAGAAFIEIPGGNHEQMGWYTGQPNDPPATISRVDQQAQVAAATVALLRAITGP